MKQLSILFLTMLLQITSYATQCPPRFSATALSGSVSTRSTNGNCNGASTLIVCEGETIALKLNKSDFNQIINLNNEYRHHSYTATNIFTGDKKVIGLFLSNTTQFMTLNPGEYDVTATYSNNNGSYQTAKIRVAVISTNVPSPTLSAGPYCGTDPISVVSETVYDYSNFSIVSINMGDGSILTPNDSGGGVPGSPTWHRVNTTHTYQQPGTYTITTTYNFPCGNRTSVKTITVGAKTKFDLTASSNEICPKKHQTTLGYTIDLMSSGSNVAIWTKDGQPFLNSGSISQAGNYCLQFINRQTGCASEIKCTTIVESPCIDINPAFSFDQHNSTSTFTITLKPNDKQNCVTHGWWIKEIKNGVVSNVHHEWSFGGGSFLLNYTFKVASNISYKIVHGAVSRCSKYKWASRHTNQPDFNQNNGGTNRFKKSIGVLNNSTTKEISIHPNPVQNKVVIDLTMPDQTYTIVNSIGKIMEEGNSKTVDVSMFDSGLYFVRIYSGSGELLMVEKLVKM